jgi:NADH-quinone oxidoreductase subunit M
MYIWFEAILIPFFIVIGTFGNKGRRVVAAYYFFFYTLVGSLGMLGSIIYLQVWYDTTSFTDILFLDLSPLECNIMFFLFFIGIAVKTPLVPGHLWLPEAHVEAPTLGSIILAALLLKMGGFAIIRILLPLFNGAIFFFDPLIFSICLVSMVHAGLHAIRQTDIKKIIALSSIVHMAFATIGLIIPTTASIQSAIVLMLGHGLVSGGLFYCIGCIYDRYNTRDLNVISSLWHYTPRLSAFLFLFIFANLSFPGTVNFVPELGIFWGAFSSNHILPIFIFFGYIFNTIYNIWLLSRILYGPFIKVEVVNTPEDLSSHETAILGFLGVFTIFFGFFPDYIFEDLAKGYNFLWSYVD